jgi:hypothetical protein
VVDAGPLPGILQSSYRAEIFAIMRALSISCGAKGRVHLWTDCKAVVLRLQRLLLGLPVKPNSKHSDLWMVIADLLGGFESGQVVVTRVSAHQCPDNATGPLQEWCFVNNGFADRAAVRAHQCRSASFWSCYAQHVAATFAAREISQAIQQVLLKVSRIVLSEKDVQDEPVADQLCEPLPVPPEAWTPPTQLSIPHQAVRWYGDENVRTLLSWYWGQVYSSNFPLLWVSQFHLYLDFQMAGEVGPTHLGRWQLGDLYPMGIC